MDGFWADGGGVKITFARLFQARMDPIGGRRHRIAQNFKRAQRVRAAQNIVPRGNFVAPGRIADVAGMAARVDVRDIGKRQAPVPGIIEAQHIRQVGAVGEKMRPARIAGGKDIGAAVQTRIHAAATRGSDRGNELAKAPLIPGAPRRLANRIAGSGRCRQDQQGPKDKSKPQMPDAHGATLARHQRQIHVANSRRQIGGVGVLNTIRRDRVKLNPSPASTPTTSAT